MRMMVPIITLISEFMSVWVAVRHRARRHREPFMRASVFMTLITLHMWVWDRPRLLWGISMRIPFWWPLYNVKS